MNFNWIRGALVYVLSLCGDQLAIGVVLKVGRDFCYSSVLHK
jgi:hypothetical protein